MQVEKNINDPEIWGGIECTINRVQDRFFDQLQYSGHYNRTSDIAQLAQTGIKKMRYPVLWEAHQPERDSVIDWTWTSRQLTQLKEHNIEVIAGLVHHGSGPAFTNLLDDQFPYLLADYASKVIEQFPHINYFTPVNEPLTTARFSGLYGFWYPHRSDDASFLKMLINELKGVVLSMQAIRKINPQAKLVQTEDLGKTYSTKSLQYQADFENYRRWLTYDLLCGRLTPTHPLWDYLRKHDVPEQDLLFFQENICVPDVFGFNHYVTSERYLDGRLYRYPQHTHGGNGRQAYADVEAVRVNLKEETGIGVLLKEAWDRYRKPMAVTEVHLHCHREEQLRWFNYIWKSCQQLVAEGVKIEGVTLWAMLGSFGWNKLLTEPNGEYEPGVFDVRNGTPRPTALAGYVKSLAHQGIDHHLTIDKGWWQRPSRYFYKPTLLPDAFKPMPDQNKPLLIIGKRGTLGRAFAHICDDRYLHYVALGRETCDITDLDSIEKAIANHRPWAIINTAGFVRVDDAEIEPDKCFADNTIGAQNLAIASARHGIQLVSFSSDLVFDGEKKASYFEEDKTNPLNIYGHSKAKAEEAVLTANPGALVVRTSAFFGPWDSYNFAHAVQQSLQNEELFMVAVDTMISPTYVPDLAHATLDLLVDGEKGIWHLANNGELSWADFANEIADRLNLNRKYIKAVPASAIPLPAKRPTYSVLSSSRGMLLPTLDNALKRYTNEITERMQQQKSMAKKERA
ncbi:dTDP-4-dehydrorhamnose reductase [Flavisolibacter sp. BT320]|nr:dTDP-4-dehydrorhamnose reductase [Flavisolibacter longurius]